MNIDPGLLAIIGALIAQIPALLVWKSSNDKLKISKKKFEDERTAAIVKAQDDAKTEDVRRDQIIAELTEKAFTSVNNEIDKNLKRISTLEAQNCQLGASLDKANLVIVELREQMREQNRIHEVEMNELRRKIDEDARTRDIASTAMAEQITKLKAALEESYKREKEWTEGLTKWLVRFAELGIDPVWVPDGIGLPKAKSKTKTLGDRHVS